MAYEVFTSVYVFFQSILYLISMGVNGHLIYTRLNREASIRKKYLNLNISTALGNFISSCGFYYILRSIMLIFSSNTRLTDMQCAWDCSIQAFGICISLSSLLLTALKRCLIMRMTYDISGIFQLASLIGTYLFAAIMSFMIYFHQLAGLTKHGACDIMGNEDITTAIIYILYIFLAVCVICSVILNHLVKSRIISMMSTRRAIPSTSSGIYEVQFI